MALCMVETIKSWLRLLLTVISIFWILNYFKKLLNPIINSMQVVVWFKVYFLNEKIYKKCNYVQKRNNKVIIN